MDSNLKTAFIISIIGLAFSQLMLIVPTSLYEYFNSLINDRAVFITVILTIMAAPIVLGIISLSYLKKVDKVEPQYRPYLIISRVFSIVAIAFTGAIMILFFFLFSLLVLLIGAIF